MSISSPKFNLYWKHGNTRTQFYKSDLLVWSYCHQWVYSREHGMRNGIQVHYISKTECPKLPVTHTLLKKKKGKKTMRYFPSQMLLNKWMVSVPRFLSHSEITESPTWSIKKKKINSHNFFIHENKNLSYFAISSRGSYFTESSNFDLCIEFPIEAHSIFLCWINPS